MQSSPAGADPVEDLMARWLAEPASERAALLERLCAEHADLAGELRVRVEALVAMGLGGALGRDGLAGEPLPERLGEFRLLEQLGGGGMGVVYRAEQTSLGREVALKLVRPELVYFPGARARFRREVEAIARLKHPGIVPVYAVGEERGLPWFTMELVEGCTLSELLAALAARAPASLAGDDLAQALRASGVEPEEGADGVFALGWVDACLSLARDVADALAHAHARGIVHRDVKPSNVILTARGRAVLIDFGLTSSAGAERLTHTGSQPGTPLYMAPEQVRGASVDARADVYALGVTLHELLALEPRFQGRDASALRAAIVAGDARALRERNARVPRDVEAIVRVATDVAPERRYLGAALLARDLENALARRPVLARPPGALLSAARWVRRHPVLSIASLSGLALLAGIPSALYFQQRRHSAGLGVLLAEQEAAAARERSLREQEQTARVDAEASVEFLFNLVNEAMPERLQGRTFDLEQWLERGLATLDELAYRPEFTGRFLVFSGEALIGLGKLDRAIEVLGEAGELERDRGGAGSEWRMRALSSLATALQQRARYAEAEELFREALAGFVASRGEASQHAAVAHNNLGNLLMTLELWSDAEVELSRAIASYSSLAAPDRRSLVTVRSNYAVTLGKLGRSAEGIAQLERALADARALSEADPLFEASILNSLGLTRRAQGDLAGAESALREALALYGRVHAGPDLAYAFAHFNLGQALSFQGRTAEALEEISRGLDDMGALGLADHPQAEFFRDRRDALELELVRSR